MNNLPTYYNIAIERDIDLFKQRDAYQTRLILFVSDKEIDSSENFWRKPKYVTYKTQLAYFLYKKISRVIKEYEIEDLDVLPIDIALATNFILPIGHPVKEVIYVSHPSSREIYYPFSDYHKYLFEQKFSELLSILISLGAIEVSIEAVKGKSFDISSSLSTDFFDGAVKCQSENHFQAFFKGTYNASNKPPSLPENLIWYNFEETWKQLANGRLNNNLKEFSLTLTYKDDFGINAELKTKIECLEFNIGGNFDKFQSTEWKISGKFY